MTAFNTEHNSDEHGGQSGHMMITIKNGIATISGNTESGAEAALTEHLLSQLNSVKHVINLAT
ncbi:MAG: BON domain-containing protein [Pseudomonadota bacterium]